MTRSRMPLLRDFALILVGAALAVALLGLARLGRQFPAAAASPALLVPFLLPVLGLSLEAGALVALSTAQLRHLVRRDTPLDLPSGGGGGGALSSFARVRATLPLLGLLVLVLGAAELVPRGTEHPGAFANELVQTARASCGGDAKGTVPVPLLGLSVSCGARRIEGPMPGVRSIQVAMSELTFSDDLRRVDIVGLELTAARALRVHLRAGRARIAGLAPWSRSPRLSPWGRFAILATLGGVLWLAAALGWRAGSTSAANAVSPSARGDGRRRRWASWAATLLLAVPGAVVAAGFISLDQERAAPTAYAGSAMLGLAAIALVRLLASQVPRIFSSFTSFGLRLLGRRAGGTGRRNFNLCRSSSSPYCCSSCSAVAASTRPARAWGRRSGTSSERSPKTPSPPSTLRQPLLRP